MGKYLEALRKRENAQPESLKNQNNPSEDGSLGFLGSPESAIQDRNPRESPGGARPELIAWSETEVELCKQRVGTFIQRGLKDYTADALASRLVERDRMQDDRRACAECQHLAGARCQIGLTPFGGVGPEALHRCHLLREGLIAGAEHLDPIGPAPLPVQDCRDCRNIRRPGSSRGYCSADIDTPAAYGGDNHPLRQLPADKGASCALFNPIHGGPK